jgi:hypothetical protein
LAGECGGAAFERIKEWGEAEEVIGQVHVFEYVDCKA